MIIGITGGTGSGKSTLLKEIEALGGVVMDCDVIYHELLEKSPALLSAIGSRFPGTVEQGVLLRKKLGAIVFADPGALQDLNAITHSAVREEVLRRLTPEPRLAAIDAIGLFESRLNEVCRHTVAVCAPTEQRIWRLMARDGITREYALSRIQAQESDEVFRARCEYTLENNGTREEFREKCKAFLREIQIERKGVNAMTNEELKAALTFTPKNAYAALTPEDREAMEAYCKDYARFMDSAKTEREAVIYTVDLAEKAGFKPLVPGMELKPGDRVYRNNRGKSALFAVIGKAPLSEGVNIVASHVDSPRLDLKPNPLYEDAEIAFLKTHYYGGIKKYQWTTVPMALHGVVCRKDGTVVTVTIGEDEGDPVLCISDLLVHLSGDQMRKTLAEGITGEQLNVIVGTEPLSGEGSDLVKLAVLKLLNEKYGIIEEDFRSAELTIVPAGKCREVGLDRSLLGAYGHDDRVCAYASFAPLLELAVPDRTAVCILADKEEIGSVGISGMQSRCFENFMEDLCATQAVGLNHCFAKSFCLSADVSNAFDPNFPETCDRRNNSLLNYGVAICKYTGSRGKGGASDASAEVMGYIRRVLDGAGVAWQMATLGKVDQGGGGTVAAYMANRNIEVVDAGVPVLSMHAPWELVSKLDCYMTMKAAKAVYDAKL